MFFRWAAQRNRRLSGLLSFWMQFTVTEAAHSSATCGAGNWALWRHGSEEKQATWVHWSCGVRYVVAAHLVGPGDLVVNSWLYMILGLSKWGGTPHHPKSDHFSIETNGLSGLPYFRKPPYFIEPRVCILPGWTWLIFLDLVDLVPSGGGIGAWQAFSAAPQHTTRSKYMCR